MHGLNLGLNLGNFIHYLLINYNDLFRQCIANYTVYAQLLTSFFVYLSPAVSGINLIKPLSIMWWKTSIFLKLSDLATFCLLGPPICHQTPWGPGGGYTWIPTWKIISRYYRCLTRFCPSFYRTLPIQHSVNCTEIIVRGQSYFSRLPKYWPPHPPLRPASVYHPRPFCGGRTD